ncbi:hypothetical protein AC579_7419 [Pseudocercospora musae]|uniref:Uncharacterized protein n=1 Tax=Pseudocercospora musae TaxID=113226 RepID=A0A139IQZ4_9PEZI|nr:hypothetical protein AC579_7419 [Pseudocercospora musae]
MHFVKNHQSPLAGRDEVHDHLTVMGTSSVLRDHAVRADDDTCFVVELPFLAASEDGDVVRVDVRPLLELLFPLHGTHGASAKHNRALLDRTRCCNADKCLACTTGQHNNSASSASIPKHFAKGVFLVVANLDVRPKINVEISVDVVCSEVVLFGKRQVELHVTMFLHELDLFAIDLERVYLVGIVIIFLLAQELGHVFLSLTATKLVVTVLFIIVFSFLLLFDLRHGILRSSRLFCATDDQISLLGRFLGLQLYGRVIAFDEVFVVLQNKSHFSKRLSDFVDEINDVLRHFRFGEEFKITDDVFLRETYANGRE